MTARLALEIPERDERCITVSAAAERLGVNHTNVRAMLRQGLLVGIKVGKTDQPGGIRVKMWSIIDWEERHTIEPDQPTPKGQRPPRARRRMRNAADEEAAARLRAWGI